MIRPKKVNFDKGHVLLLPPVVAVVAAPANYLSKKWLHDVAKTGSRELEGLKINIWLGNDLTICRDFV